jgi:hypothetical protein
MDTRRLSTGDILSMGIINKDAPKTDVPEDRERIGFDIYDGAENDVREALERGDVVDCSEYYGIPIVWKDGEIYRGTLLQYRAVIEAPEFSDLDSAVEWFMDTARSVAG